MHLTGLNILVVEDEPLLGMDIVDTLVCAKANVDGPITNVESALREIEGRGDGAAWDVAVLDYQLGDKTCEGIADLLSQKAVPFVIHTGSRIAAENLSRKHAASIVDKPARNPGLVEALMQVVGRS